jgi:hypothetical protein
MLPSGFAVYLVGQTKSGSQHLFMPREKWLESGSP